jgi:hypothetical protein
MTDKTLPITGGCLCGAVRFEASEPASWTGYCHCSVCRRQSGAPVTVCVEFPRDAVTWIEGEPTYYNASEKASRGFCPKCGSSLTWETTSSFTVFVGSLDRPEDFRPESHGYTASQLPWLKIDDDLRRHSAHDDVQWPTTAGYDPATGKFSGES